MTTHYLAIAGQIVGTMESGYRTEFHSLGVLHRLKAAAISEGFRLRGSDDFNVGVVENGTLTAIYWMDEKHDESPETLARIAEQIGLSS